MRRSLSVMILAVILLSSVRAFGQESESKFHASLRGGIYIEADQAWTLEPSIQWNFHKYFGVGLGLEFTSQYNQPTRYIDINGVEGRLEDNERNIGWMVFKPSFVFKSPEIRLNSDGDNLLWFQAEPGLSLACPFRNSMTFRYPGYDDHNEQVYKYERLANKDLRWVYFFGRVSANVAFGNFTVGLGYTISDFDYYACRRNIYLPTGGKIRVPGREVAQTVFLSVGWKF